MTHLDDSLVAFSRERAADLAAMSVGRLAALRDRGVVTPSISKPKSDVEPWNVELYQFDDLVELLVYRELRKRHSFQKLESVLQRQQGRYKRPLLELGFAVEQGTGEILFQHSDGTWESTERLDQVVMVDVLDVERIKAELREKVSRRDPKSAGSVSTSGRRRAGAECFAGTRIKVSTVVSYLEARRTEDEILAAFPSLANADIEIARDRLVS